MARLARLTLAGHPHHIIQRGNNRQPIFRSSEDYEFLLQLLTEHAARESVSIHAYVLMSNHFHLLASPQTVVGLPKLMQSVGRRYVRYFNQRYQRTGTLWEGRYKATLIQTERYLFTCMAYLDLNPVRAGIVTRAADYPWSSHGHYAGQRQDKLITSHQLYWQLGNTPFAREAGYVELVNQGVSADQRISLTDSVQKGWALGDPDFVSGLQKHTPRRLSRTRPGRPSVKSKPESK